MQARQNIAKRTCIEIYKAINSLISAKNIDYLGSIDEDLHLDFFAKKMKENVEKTYGINKRDYIYNENCQLSDGGDCILIIFEEQDISGNISLKVKAEANTPIDFTEDQIREFNRSICFF